MGNNHQASKQTGGSHHFPYINHNVASVISRYLSYKDLFNIGCASKQMYSMFLNNEKIFHNEIDLIQERIDRENLKRDFKTFAKENYKSLSHMLREVKYIYSIENINGENKNGYKAIRITAQKTPEIIFSAHPFGFDWKGDPNYWPMELKEGSIFQHTIPHLKSVCWFRFIVLFELKVEPGYKVLLRMAADNNFDIKQVDFVLDYNDGLLKGPAPLLKKDFTDDDIKRFKMLKGNFDYWQFGSFKLSKTGSDTITLCFTTTERTGWWKHGWWLDAFVFIPIGN